MAEQREVAGERCKSQLAFVMILDTLVNRWPCRKPIRAEVALFGNLPEVPPKQWPKKYGQQTKNRSHS